MNISIFCIGNKILYTKSDYVLSYNFFDFFTYNFFLLMNKFNGIGLAAPQVGLLKKFFLCIFIDDNGFFINKIYINPYIFYRSFNLLFSGYEGCLSVPKFYGLVNRYKDIGVFYVDKFDKFFYIYLNELNSRVIQHEFDHLNGILFISRLFSVRIIIYVI